MASASVESPALVPEPGEAAEPAKVDAPKADAPRPDAPKVDAPKVEAAKPDAPRVPGKVLDHVIRRPRLGAAIARVREPEAEQDSGMFGKRRVSALAAVVALAAVAGALGGALATAGSGHFAGDEAQAAGNRALEALGRADRCRHRWR